MGRLACFHRRPLNLSMGLRWSVCGDSRETGLLYPSCLRPLCLLGDLSNLGTRWLGGLAELGGLAGRGRWCRLCGLRRRGRLCRLRGLQGLTFRGALGLGRKTKGQSELVTQKPLLLNKSSVDPEGGGTVTPSPAGELVPGQRHPAGGREPWHKAAPHIQEP